MKPVFVKAATLLNNRAENSHQPTRKRERRMRGFRDPKRTQQFLSCFGPIRQHFALKRHLLRASLHRNQLASRFAAWHELTQRLFSKLPPHLPPFRLSLGKLKAPPTGFVRKGACRSVAVRVELRDHKKAGHNKAIQSQTETGRGAQAREG